jgi:hypothetical protein
MKGPNSKVKIVAFCLFSFFAVMLIGSWLFHTTFFLVDGDGEKIFSPFSIISFIVSLIMLSSIILMVRRNRVF